MASLAVGKDGFTLDGKAFRTVGGAIHYFRVPRAYWEDRLLRLRACGLNTVETSVAWNLHEPSPGEFRFQGDLDLAAYLRTAERLGLKAVVRPGPYICSEWDLGGLPSWLLRDPAMRLRCMYAPYVEAVDRFFDRLIAPQAPPDSPRFSEDPSASTHRRTASCTSRAGPKELPGSTVSTWGATGTAGRSAPWMSPRRSCAPEGTSL